MSSVTASHIHLDDQGVAWIDDSNVKVVEVVLDKIAHASSVEEMHFQYPHLSLGQLHAALSYYHDHQTEMDAEIEQRLEKVDELAEKFKDSPFRQRLGKA